VKGGISPQYNVDLLAPKVTGNGTVKDLKVKGVVES
jgi:hypothetical protein